MGKEIEILIGFNWWVIDYPLSKLNLECNCEPRAKCGINKVN